MRRIILIVLMIIVITLTNYHLLAYDKSKEKVVHLAKVKQINGYYCKGWITTSLSGRLISFDSSAPIIMSNGIIPAGSRIILYSNLKIQTAYLAKPTRIQGLLCIGYGPDGPPIIFYPNGRLKVCHLKLDTWIQGILCRHGSFTKIILDHNGRLFYCELAKTQFIQGQTIKARSIIIFDDNGKISHISKSNKLRALFFNALDKFL